MIHTPACISFTLDTRKKYLLDSHYQILWTRQASRQLRYWKAMMGNLEKIWILLEEKCKCVYWYLGVLVEYSFTKRELLCVQTNQRSPLMKLNNPKINIQPKVIRFKLNRITKTSYIVLLLKNQCFMICMFLTFIIFYILDINILKIILFNFLSHSLLKIVLFILCVPTKRTKKINSSWLHTQY